MCPVCLFVYSKKEKSQLSVADSFRPDSKHLGKESSVHHILFSAEHQLALLMVQNVWTLMGKTTVLAEVFLS